MDAKKLLKHAVKHALAGGKGRAYAAKPWKAKRGWPAKGYGHDRYGHPDPYRYGYAPRRPRGVRGVIVWALQALVRRLSRR